MYISISIYLYIYVYISIYVYVYISICPSIYIYLSIYPSIYLYAYLYLYLSIYIYLSIYLRIYTYGTCMYYDAGRAARVPDHLRSAATADECDSRELGTFIYICIYLRTFLLFNVHLLLWCCDSYWTTVSVSTRQSLVPSSSGFHGYIAGDCRQKFNRW